MMKLSNNKRINKLVKDLIKKGWCIKKGTKHHKLVSPEGFTTTIPSTPSDWRAGTNFAKDIKRIQARRHT
ncbi:hypothetical protein CWI69_00370 [Pseudidiomarina halophila]|uniref:Addiction module toxin, HicA family n=1 Tax=Pseudidiomarina halophila TaxID=1449799 RepID=A0A432XYY6_9GAMM|nr:hypothetical protein CWI69_00370 [Pseudidiomarina halophila]